LPERTGWPVILSLWSYVQVFALSNKICDIHLGTEEKGVIGGFWGGREERGAGGVKMEVRKGKYIT
jgi:hypothetical protein